MGEFTAADLAIVIPTRERWDILDRTLASLSEQTVTGFESIVVVDGTDQDPPPLAVSHMLVKRRAGPGAARNAGARTTERPLIMFIGDDTIPAPDLVERHLAAHSRHPEREAAAVGLTDWHPEVAGNRINRWLEWSGTQSWYGSLADEGEQEVSHWYFYTSNLSLKRELLVEGEGFDEDFPFAAFEDLECGLRLSRLGLRLYYEPAAVCHHLHDYDWPGLERRFSAMALSERLMVEKHPELEAGCLRRMEASAQGPALALDPLVDVVPRRWKRLDQFVRRQTDRSYHRRLTPLYLSAWDRAAELCELRRYLGPRYDSGRLVYGSRPEDGEDAGSDDEQLFALARRALEGRTDEVVAALRRHLPPGARLLEYRCGIGSDGLRLARAGYSVQFADHAGRPLSYLAWRLADRGLQLPVYDLDVDTLPGDLDAVVCLDAGGSGSDPGALLAELEPVAALVALAFLTEPAGRALEPPHATELPAPRGSRSRLLARHELSGGSLLLLYSTDRSESATVADAIADPADGAALPERG